MNKMHCCLTQAECVVFEYRCLLTPHSCTQGRDIRLFSSGDEDSSLYFTYSGGCNELEVRNLHYQVFILKHQQTLLK